MQPPTAAAPAPPAAPSAAAPPALPPAAPDPCSPCQTQHPHRKAPEAGAVQLRNHPGDGQPERAGSCGTHPGGSQQERAGSWGTCPRLLAASRRVAVPRATYSQRRPLWNLCAAWQHAWQAAAPTIQPCSILFSRRHVTRPGEPRSKPAPPPACVRCVITPVVAAVTFVASVTAALAHRPGTPPLPQVAP